VLFYQSDFDWIDLRSYDIRVAWDCEVFACSPGQGHLAHSMHTPALSGQWVRERLSSLLAHERERCMSDEGRVSLTNLCGQLVVTGILRMQSGSRDQRLTPVEPMKVEHISLIQHACAGSGRGLSSLVTRSLMSSKKELMSSCTRGVWCLL
jgi:hypothetical protein